MIFATHRASRGGCSANQTCLHRRRVHVDASALAREPGWTVISGAPRTPAGVRWRAPATPTRCPKSQDAESGDIAQLPGAIAGNPPRIFPGEMFTRGRSGVRTRKRKTPERKRESSRGKLTGGCSGRFLFQAVTFLGLGFSAQTTGGGRSFRAFRGQEDVFLLAYPSPALLYVLRFFPFYFPIFRSRGYNVQTRRKWNYLQRAAESRKQRV